MRTALVFAVLAAGCSTPPGPGGGVATPGGAAHEVRIPVGDATLFAREIGQGPSIVVLHGGPDFDQGYLLPDMDRLADAYRLVYYDQRGRGKSASGVRPEDVSMASDIADLDRVRENFQLPTTVLLGHSWGTVLALEYAIQHSDKVSRLILMNPAPATHDDYLQLREQRVKNLGPELDRMKAIAATEAFKQGDPDAVTAYYTIHFTPALVRTSDRDKVLAALKASFTKEGVLKARAIEDRLMADTWTSPNGYDLRPKLRRLTTPTLVIYGDHDMIPKGTSEHIIEAMPKAVLVTLQSCGHFAYLECPDATRRAIDAFLR